MAHKIIPIIFTCVFLMLAQFVFAEGLTVHVTKPIQQQDTVGRVDLDSETSSFSIVSSENFENRHAELSKIIEHETGVQVLNSGGVGGFSSASIRGASSEQIAVYVDGVLLNQASGGAVDLSLISLDNVESVELFRGSVPMELGNASLGGAVNIITKQSAQGFNGKLKATLGSFNTQQYNAFASAGSNVNNFMFSANSLQSDNDYEFVNDNGTENNPDDDRTEKRNNSALSKDSVLAKHRYRINTHKNVDSKLEWLNKYQQIPGVQNSPDADASLTLDSIDFVSQYNQREFFSSQAEFSAKVFAGQLDERFIDDQASIGFLPSDVDSSTDNYGTEVFYKYKPETYQFKYRLLYERQDYASDNILNNLAKQDSSRDYYEQALEYKDFSFENSLISSLTLRHVYAQDTNNLAEDVFGNQVDIVDRDYDVFTPQLGIKYKFNASGFVNFNIGKYVRLPSFFELFGNQGFFKGSPDLQEENGVNLDLGYSYSVFRPGSWLDEARFYMGYFHNKAENLIVRETVGQGFSVSRNITDAVINGIEANLKLYPLKPLSLLFNATYIDSENTSDTVSYNGKRLPGQYEQDYNVHVSYNHNSWILDISWDIKKNMYYDRPNLLKASDISDINLSVLRKWQHHALEFKAENLLDKQYENFRLQPTAGTSYFLTYTYRL